MGDTPDVVFDGALRQHIELVGVAYADWEAEIRRISMAADRAETSGGFVDAQNLVRAGEIAAEIDVELQGINEISFDLVGEAASQVSGVKDRLAMLRELARDAARRMHGRT